jgi:amidase
MKGGVNMEKLIYSSASKLARAIRTEEVSSEEVVEAYLQRIEEVNPKLNAVVQLITDDARAQAREADASLKRGEIKGPLHGVPITIKDNIDAAGLICTGGTKGRASFIPKQDATVVTRMRNAGAILLGKTNLPELALAFETDNLIYGRTNNPYDLSCTPGGSSGGEAAIIAAGGSPLGLGNDMAGSIRIPSHFCGIAGIKPTSGRVPWTSDFPHSSGLLNAFWQIGPMARFVEDLILTLPVIAGVDGRDPTVVPIPLGDPNKVDLKSLRMAFYTDNGMITPTPETIKVVMKTAKLLSDTGMAMKEDRPEGVDKSFGLWLDLFRADGGAEVRRTLQLAGTTELHPWLQGLLDRANQMTSPEFADLMAKWHKFRSSMLSFMEKYDAIICPVNAYPALPHGGTLDKRVISVSYTMTYNLTGWPVAVVRAGTSPEGLPIGVQVVARPWREDLALAISKHVESTLNGWKEPPI